MRVMGEVQMSCGATWKRVSRGKIPKFPNTNNWGSLISPNFPKLEFVRYGHALATCSRRNMPPDSQEAGLIQMLSMSRTMRERFLKLLFAQTSWRSTLFQGRLGQHLTRAWARGDLCFQLRSGLDESMQKSLAQCPLWGVHQVVSILLGGNMVAADRPRSSWPFRVRNLGHIQHTRRGI
jgi:hypothetical protein